MRPGVLFATFVALFPLLAHAQGAPASAVRAPREPLMERRSPEAIVGGIATTGLGAASIVVSAFLFARASSEEAAMAPCDPETTEACPPLPSRNGAAVLAIVGGAAIAAGIPLIVYGAKKVPVGQREATLNIGPGRVGLVVRF